MKFINLYLKFYDLSKGKISLVRFFSTRANRLCTTLQTNIPRQAQHSDAAGLPPDVNDAAIARRLCPVRVVGKGRGGAGPRWARVARAAHSEPSR